MKKLTRAQQEVVELLKRNPTYVIKDISGFWGVVRPQTKIFTRPVARWIQQNTFNALLRLNIIKPTDQKDIYVLSEKE